MQGEKIDETVIKEYPNSTQWLEDGRVVGVGNLILTDRRLVFLNRVTPSEQQIENIRKLHGAPTSQVLNYALTLHKKNFQIPLSSLTRVKMGVFFVFPFPHFSLRIYYLDKTGKKTKDLTFFFILSFLKRLQEFEISIVLGWVWTIRKAMKARVRENSASKRAGVS